MASAATRRWSGLFFLLVLLFPGATGAIAGDQVERGAVPAWVVPILDAPTTSTATAEDGLRILLLDSQSRAEADSQSFYMRSRTVALSPQALPFLGNVGMTWSPSSQAVTVHHVNIIRDGEVIDVLATQNFETLRREENLEQAMLDGQLTALLQPAGLRIGDILDFAYTVVSRDPVTGSHVELAVDLNLPTVIDQVRYRASWPRSVKMRLRAVDDWVPLEVQRDGSHSVVEVRQNAVQPIIIPDYAPGRIHRVRSIELSDYRDWSDIAVTLKPLYDRARRLDPDSPLHAEITRIRSLSDDPAVRAAAALRLVQEQVRYVALLMGDGALVPATADETWARRFGDCKAKTALLLALLDGLGIAAEPAAVSILNGDGMNERLPMISAFDHVLVRATVGGTVHWLDGTQTGDRQLADISVPSFYWALPLSGPQAQLERLVVAPKTVPDTETTLALDASAGLYAPASVVGTLVMRGSAASVLGGQLGLVSGSQKDQGLRDIWSAQLKDPTITEVGSIYDADASILTLTMKGSVTLDWSAEGLVPPGSTYWPITSQPRPEGAFRSTPYVVSHPFYSRQVATLRLPDDGSGFRVSGGEFDRTELGYHMRRSARLDGDQVTIETTMLSLANEVSAADADQTRAEAAVRPHDPPRVFVSAGYSPTEADRVAWDKNAPTTSSGWLDRAFVLSQTGDREGAIEAADRAVELAPDSSNAWANRGVHRFWNQDLEGAAADLQKAVDIDPSERIAMNGHALIAMSEDRYDDAVIEMSRALRQMPGDDWTLQMRAMMYLALEQYDHSLRDTDARIAARPDDMEIRLSRIATLNTAGRDQEAEAEMDALAEQYPAGRHVLLNQAALKLERGNAQLASEILDRVLATEPDNPTSALTLRAEAALALGRLDIAERDFNAIRAAKPDDATALNNLCWIAAEAGVMLDQALKDCDAALVLQPDAAHIIDSRARVLLQSGDLAGALVAYDAALSKAPNLAASLYGRGLTRIALGQTLEGEADKSAAIEIAPTVPDSFKSYSTSQPGITP